MNNPGPFLLIQAQQTDQVLLKNRGTQIGLEVSTAQNQSEMQVLSATRDNLSANKQCQQLSDQKRKFMNRGLNLENLTTKYKVSKS